MNPGKVDRAGDSAPAARPDGRGIRAALAVPVAVRARAHSAQLGLQHAQELQHQIMQLGLQRWEKGMLQGGHLRIGSVWEDV